MNPLFAVTYLMFVVALPSIAESDVIYRRDGLAEIHGEILSGGENGLLVKTDEKTGLSISVPWSTIARIEPMERKSLFQRFLADGDKLWRAKKRLLRGDVQLSEPIFASRFNKLLGMNGEDARLASEGLLRVLVARGALRQALIPWLETVRLEELGFASPFQNLEPIIDATTLLCPHLPVGALPSAEFQLLEVRSSKRATIAGSFKKLLHDGPEHSSQLVDLKAEGPLFVAQLLQSSSGSLQAVHALEKRLDKLLEWQKIWAHYSIGVGYLYDNSEPNRAAGLLHLATVCSTDPTFQPWITGAAMLRLSTELNKDGLTLQANRILHEAKRLFPSHPLLLNEDDKHRNLTP